MQVIHRSPVNQPSQLRRFAAPGNPPPNPAPTHRGTPAFGSAALEKDSSHSYGSGDCLNQLLNNKFCLAALGCLAAGLVLFKRVFGKNRPSSRPSASASPFTAQQPKRTPSQSPLSSHSRTAPSTNTLDRLERGELHSLPALAVLAESGDLATAQPSDAPQDAKTPVEHQRPNSASSPADGSQTLRKAASSTEPQSPNDAEDQDWIIIDAPGEDQPEASQKAKQKTKMD